MAKNQMEFANFVCKFGEKNLLDYVEEIVLPAFRQPLSRTQEYYETTYFFEKVTFFQVEHEGTTVYVIAGRFVKSKFLKREQIHDKQKGVVPSFDKMASAPSSIFVLVLNNHKLLYLPETSEAPGIESFANTCQVFLREIHGVYLEGRLQEALLGVRRTKNTVEQARAALLREIPKPTVEIVPLAVEETVAQYILGFNVLRSLTLQLINPNDELDNSELVDSVRSAKNRLGATKGQATFSDPKGLSKSEAVDFVTDVATQGNARVKLEGIDADKNPIRGTVEEIKYSVPHIPEDTNLQRNALTMLNVFFAKMNNKIFGKQKEISDDNPAFERIQRQFDKPDETTS